MERESNSMLMYTENNTGPIYIVPQSISDGIKVGMIIEKFKESKNPIKVEINNGEISRIIIEQKELLGILCKI